MARDYFDSLLLSNWMPVMEEIYFLSPLKYIIKYYTFFQLVPTVLLYPIAYLLYSPMKENKDINGFLPTGIFGRLIL